MFLKCLQGNENLIFLWKLNLLCETDNSKLFFFNVITLIIETGMDYTDYTLEIGWNGYLYIVTFHI